MLPDRPLNNRDLCEFLTRWFADNYPTLLTDVRAIVMHDQEGRERIRLPFVFVAESLPTARGERNGGRDQEPHARRQAIVRILAERGHRLTLTPLVEELREQGHEWSSRAIQRDLAALEEAGKIDNRQDVKPQGYGFPEWNRTTTPD